MSLDDELKELLATDFINNAHPLDFAEAIAKTKAPLADKITVLIKFNLHKQVPLAMVPVCEQAVNLANLGEPMTTLVDLPENIWFKGDTKCTIQDIIDGHRLEALLNTYNREETEARERSLFGA